MIPISVTAFLRTAGAGADCERRGRPGVRIRQCGRSRHRGRNCFSGRQFNWHEHGRMGRTAAFLQGWQADRHIRRERQ